MFLTYFMSAENVSDIKLCQSKWTEKKIQTYFMSM